jgi:hypothetical protein
MTSLTAPTDRLRRRLIVVASAIVLVLAAIAASVLLGGGSDRQSVSVVGRENSPASDPALVVPEPAAIGAGRMTPESDPEAFARLVADALFSWDTAAPTNTNELTERLIAVADPTGESSAGLRADVAGYLPTSAFWTELRQYETRQWIEISTADVPELWPTAVEQAGPGGLLPGTTAYTIRGVRHRAGIWEGQPVTSAHDVAFTVFLVCGPSYPECHLLRLSRLDAPLD